MPFSRPLIVLSVLVFTIALVGFYEITQLSTQGDLNLSRPTPTPSIDALDGNGDIEGSGGGATFVAPEYGVGGGIVALILCFLAFGLFSRRKSLTSLSHKK